MGLRCCRQASLDPLLRVAHGVRRQCPDDGGAQDILETHARDDGVPDIGEDGLVLIVTKHHPIVVVEQHESFGDRLDGLGELGAGPGQFLDRDTVGLGVLVLGGMGLGKPDCPPIGDHRVDREEGDDAKAAGEREQTVEVSWAEAIVLRHAVQRFAQGLLAQAPYQGGGGGRHGHTQEDRRGK